MYLVRFFLSIRKPTSGSKSISGDRQYEPDTLRCIHSSIHRHLQQNGYKGNIKKGEAFKHSRDVLAAKQKRAKKARQRQQGESLTTIYGGRHEPILGEEFAWHKYVLYILFLPLLVAFVRLI
jgi:hypothetical protein